jgi:hexulose-6-phosphate isomerase
MVYAPFVSAPPVPYDAAWDRALETVSAAAAHAKACGVRIGVENVWNSFLLSPLEMRTFLDAIGDPFVGAYLDVGNVIQFGFPEHWVRILGSRILKSHVKDFRRSVGTLSGFVDLLSGDVDFPEVMKAFGEVGYDDYIIAEVGAYRHYGDQSVYNLAAAMRRIVG